MWGFFRFMHFPSSGSPKRKDLFNPFSLKKYFSFFLLMPFDKKMAETNKFPESGNKTSLVVLFGTKVLGNSSENVTLKK